MTAAAERAIAAQPAGASEAPTQLQPTLWRPAAITNLAASLAGDASLRVQSQLQAVLQLGCSRRMLCPASLLGSCSSRLTIKSAC